MHIAIGILGSGLCLYLALRGIAWIQVGDAFRRADYSTLPLFTALLFAFFWLKAIRWRLLLEPVRKMGTAQVTPALMIGFMGNNLLPAHLGELVRVFVLAHQFSLPRMAVLSSVALERVLDVVVILGLLVFGVLRAGDLPAWVQTGGLGLGAGVVVAILLMVAYGFRTDWFVSALRRGQTFLSPRLGRKLAEMVFSGAQGLGALRRNRLAVWIGVTSLAQWILMVAMVYISIWSFGVRITPLASLVTVGVVAMGVAVPSTPGFFGVVQLCFWISLQGFGVEKADAFASSIYFHLGQYLPVTLVGLYYLARSGLRLGEIGESAQTGVTDTGSPARDDQEAGARTSTTAP